MNCPGACLVYGSERHSYRDLPLRLAEFGLCTRNEREGVLHGLLRVRAFTQDDAHVYCTEDQIVGEVRDITEAIDELYALFGFDDVRVELSTRPEKSIGTDAQWEMAESRAAQALEEMGREYKLQPGRRRLLRPEDRLPHHRRARSLLAVRHVPARLLHAGALRPHLHRADDTQRTPVMIHRALLGSIERFLGILIEHHAGEFPVWLAPVQARVLPIADRHAAYAAARGATSCAPPACGPSRRALGVGGPQDPRRRAGQGSVHAGRRRQGGGGGRACPCGATARAISA